MYKATAKILIRLNPQQQLILFRDLATPGEEIKQVNPGSDLIEMLTSQKMAFQVIEKFGLDKKLRKYYVQEPEKLRDKMNRFISKVITFPITLSRYLGLLEKKTEMNYFAKAIKDFMKDAQDIQLEANTNVINLSIWEKSPKFSSDIANYMAKELIKEVKGLDQTSAEEAYNFTESQVQVFQKSLLKCENDLLEFKKRESIISLAEQKEAKLSEIHTLENQYINIEIELSEVKAKLKQFQKEISNQKQILLNSTAIYNSPVITGLKNSLNNIEIQLASDLKKFAESSNDIISLKAQTEETKNKLEKELKMITQNDISILHSIHSNLPYDYLQFTADVEALKAKKETLKKEIDSLKVEAFSLSLKEPELEKYYRAIELNKKLYEELSDKYAKLEVQKIYQMSGYDLKIIDEAYIPEDAKPDWPKWILIIPLGLMGSILFSGGTLFFIEYWDDSFKSPEEIEDWLRLPVLCLIPYVK